MNTEVVRSARRKKTVQAHIVDGVLRIHIPDYFDAATEAYWVDEMTTRVKRSRASEAIDLTARASSLADRYALPHPEAIRWSTRQRILWGSCTPSTGSIRISNRIAGFPRWVVDYVIVHELAHLKVGHHGEEFWALVDRYPRSQRARGYLEAKAEGCAHDRDDVTSASNVSPRRSSGVAPQ